MAKPGPGFCDSGFALFYGATREDGQRLVVVSGLDTLCAPLYDWQLIPLILYAESEYNASLSLAGPRSIRDNPALETAHIMYHPALHNTLLGVRLLQAHLMLKDLNEFWKKPQYQEINSDPVIMSGPGEPEVSVKWQEACTVLQAQLRPAGACSWMLTDLGETVRIGKSGKQLSLQGNPYFYFWQTDPEARSIGYEGGNDTIVAGASPLPELPAAIKARNSYLETYNPFAWQAAQNTMRYAAFFRFAKQKNEPNWRRLVGVADKIMSPQVAKTPMSWRPR